MSCEFVAFSVNCNNVINYCKWKCYWICISFSFFAIRLTLRSFRNAFKNSVKKVLSRNCVHIDIWRLFIHTQFTTLSDRDHLNNSTKHSSLIYSTTTSYFWLRIWMNSRKRFAVVEKKVLTPIGSKTNPHFTRKKWRYGLFLSTNKNVWAVEIGSRAFNCDTILNQRRLIVSEGKFFLFLFSLGKWPEIDASRFPADLLSCIPSFIIENFRRKFSVSRHFKAFVFEFVKTSDDFPQIKQSETVFKLFQPSYLFCWRSANFLCQNCVWGCQVSWKLASGFKFISGKIDETREDSTSCSCLRKTRKIKVSREN